LQAVSAQYRIAATLLQNTEILLLMIFYADFPVLQLEIYACENRIKY